ncbi:MAG: hypothetical protein OIF51_11035 [Cellvibrionaceae bacterium]|nr:hypothetical protein [Cellvibrionaceae bacterium]
MNTLSRIALLILCFFAAIACYVFGIPAGGAVFLVLGIVFEGLFWMGLFSGKKKA